MQHVFIIGSKGIPAQYGGYETFVDQLTERQVSRNIKYHVVCKEPNIVNTENKFFEYHGAECIRIHVPQFGPAQAIYYDLAALNETIRLIKKRKINKPVFYILACRIGPFMSHYVKKIHSLGGVVYINPDGHEWMRAKWSAPVKRYLKMCEQLMVKYADLVICDSKNIEQYIRTTYKKYRPNTTFIAYGADVKKSGIDDNDYRIQEWLEKNSLKRNEYYLVVGRFVPENNFETMLREFMASGSNKDLVLITNVEKNSFYERLRETTDFMQDSRVKFVGTVYDKELLKKIREFSYGYLHGHSVGGTNPSLLEALASTKINLLFDVKFNREVGGNGALYWNLDKGALAQTIERADGLLPGQISALDQRATNQIIERYSWNQIVAQYEEIFR